MATEPHKKSLAKVFFPFSFFILCGLLMSHLCSTAVHEKFWWLGLVLCSTTAISLRALFEAPLARWKELGPQRVALNAAAHNTASPSKELPRATTSLRRAAFPLKPFLLLLPVLLVFAPAARSQAQIWGARLAEALKQPHLQLSIEPPSHSTESRRFHTLSRSQLLKVTALSGSFFQLSIHGGRGVAALQGPRSTVPAPSFSIEAFALREDQKWAPDETGGADPQDRDAWVSPLSKNGTWSGSTQLLTDALKLEKSTTQRLALRIRSESGDAFFIDLTIQPVPHPLVRLVPSQGPSAPGANPFQNSAEQQGVLRFDTEVLSSVPLTQVELAVRTESGFSFRLPIGEFTGTDRSEFKTNGVQLQTAGIPFSENDVLFVKAVAHTVVSSLSGESKELRFEVKSPRETRQALMNQLEEALETLQDNSLANQEFRNKLLEQLQNAQKSANEMGRQSQAARKINEARRSAERMNPKDQEQRDAIESKLRDVLDSLKRSQSRDQANSWFMKARELLQKIASAEPDTDPGALSERSSNLATEAEALKKQLAELIENPSSGLTLDEKQQATDLLEEDETPESFADVAELLARGERNAALDQGNTALAQAAQNLGGLLQLITVARQRAIKEAREKLTQADESLENVRQSLSEAEKQKEAAAAQRRLEGTPELGEEFNDALTEAQEAAQAVRRSIRRGDETSLRRELDRSQRAIVQALRALQDEEQSSREEQGEEEGRRRRMAMDSLTAQGELDAGWRRKIFEEIARLREAGVPTDDDRIQYLESRLR